ncbi:MAG: DUF896 domain-containing protein [Peptostreptococcaceae bacterium]|nr:DUF896 domain-containing protein [Peptostreptococcaceae bacterium]
MIIKEIPRINELARISKERELTDAEKAEQAELRKRYLEAVRGATKEMLLNSTVKDPEGNDVTPQKLKDAQEKLRKARS